MADENDGTVYKLEEKPFLTFYYSRKLILSCILRTVWKYYTRELIRSCEKLKYGYQAYFSEENFHREILLVTV